MAVNEIIRRRTFSLVIRVSSKASCAKGAPFRMKKGSGQKENDAVEETIQERLQA
jgi:hypothetical protein